MSSIDQRVVQMKFDNAQFESGVKTTLHSLEALNKGLKLDGATKGLNDIGSAAKNIQLGHVASGVQEIASKFSAMSVVAITALSTIAHQAITSGGQLVKSLTISPIKSGLAEYETNLNSIQTILSNTQWQNTGLNDVNKALNTLNVYSDQTIYNFSQMARNIGTFTAAGVKLDVATAAIKGIANLAAVSGSNAEQASSAMYQLSQALAAGKVALIDWNSVVNAGMGGKVFQDALMETARVHGVAIDKMVKDAGGFRGSLEKGWLTSNVLTETLSKFTGDLTAQQLKTMGYNKQQIANILKMGKTAQDAATKVKTMSQLIGTLQEAAGSGWAKTFQLIFGDFEQAKELFTGVNNVLGGFIQASADARNKVIGDWNALGGRAVLIEAIGNAFNALIAAVKPIRDAFREIFPAATGKQIYDITVAIRDFTQNLMIGGGTAENLRRTFAGVFAVLGLGVDVIKAIVKTFFNLIGVATEGAGGFLEFTANIGDFLVGIRKAIKDGDLITIVFEKIESVLGGAIRGVKEFAGFIGSMFDKFDGQAAAKSVTGVVGQLEPLSRLGSIVSTAWSNVISILGKVWDVFQPLAEKFGEAFHELGDIFSGGLGGIDLTGVLAALGTGAIASLFISLRGLVSNVSGIFDNLTGSMKTMQNTLRAATLLQIAAAIGVLTLSVVALSKIDVGGLTRALSAITVMFGQLFGMMLLFEKLAGMKGLLKMPLIATNMIILGIALNVLAAAVKTLSELSWEELGIGLTGVATLMGILVGAMHLMPNPVSLTSTAAGLVVLAVAIRLLAESVTELSGLSWEDMAKGLVGVGTLLGALILFTKFADANKGGVLQGAGLLILAVAIKVLASAVEDFAQFKWEEMGRGLAALAGALTIVSAALMLIPPTAPFAAASVLIVALSLGKVADALQDFATMSWSEIGRGLTAMLGALTIISAALFIIPPTAPLGAAAILVTAYALLKVADVLDQMGAMDWKTIGRSMTALAGSLLIIVVAVNAMTGALAGAAAMLIVAASLAILAPVLQMFGQMSWEEMGKGLLMLAGAFTVIGIAGALLTPVVPTLIGLGIAITLLGIGMLAAGVGVLAFSAGLTALSIAGAAGAAAMVAIVAGLVGLIPMVMTQIGLGIVAFAKVIATAGPAITSAITTVLLALIKAIETLTPKIVDTLGKLMVKLLETMLKYVPKMVDTGLKLLVGVLNGIAANINQVVTAATNVVTKFIEAVGNNAPKVIQAGVNMIIKFINGLADAIRSGGPEMGKAGGNLATAIVEGMVRGLVNGAGRIASAAKNAAKSALNAAMNVLGINSPSKEFFKLGKWSDEGMANGLDKFSNVVSKSASGVGESALNSMKTTLSKMPDSISGEIDLTPQIRPVLDLTAIKKDAATIGGLLNTKPLSVEASFSNAKDASAGVKTNQDVLAEQSISTPTDSVTFNQYNNSPKALTPAEIYRNTRNQLSVAKGALAT